MGEPRFGIILNRKKNNGKEFLISNNYTFDEQINFNLNNLKTKNYGH